jgi:FAD/FMN-containing dehydrogenase
MLSTPPLPSDFEGPILTPDHPEYDAARTVFSGAVDRRPSVIVRAAGAADVARVIALARDSGSELAVRSGGHSPAGHGVSEGGITLDLSAMRGLEIDAERRTAWAEAGLTAGEYTNAAGAHGLATGFGDAGTVGLGGITLSGGVGYLVRKHGLTIDDLLAAEVVTASGELLRVDAANHPDLFWALRGGGGNFGVATRLKFRLHPVDTIVGGLLLLPATPDVIASFIVEAEAAPDELTTIANVMPAPPLPFLAPEHHGRPVVMATLVHAGDVAAGERAVAAFRALATPIADLVRPMPYPEIYPPADESYRPLAVSRTMFVGSVDRRTAETIIERIERSTAQMPVTQLRVLGGAMSRVPADATAFAHRGSRIMATVVAMYAEPETRPRHETWVRDLARDLGDGDPGAYVGFLGDEGEERVRAAYPASTWERLTAIKAQYDPENLFRLNQNIPPAGA